MSIPTLAVKRENPFQKPQALAFQKYDPKNFNCTIQDLSPKLQLLPQIQQNQVQVNLQSATNEHYYPRFCSPTFVKMKE